MNGKVLLFVLVFLMVPAFAQDRPVTIDEIVEMLRNDVPEANIAQEIRVRGCRCRVGAFDLMVLKGAGASEELIRAIQQEGDTVGRVPDEPAIGTREPRSLPVPTPTNATVFGGYSYGRSEGDLGGFNWHGFNGAVTGHVNDWFAITGDVSWLFTDPAPGLDVGMLHFGVGPQFSTWGRTRRTRGFGHVLFGATRFGVELLGLIGDSETRFSTAVGGGLDVGLTRNFGIRVFQSDWIRLWNLNGGSGDFLRLSFGVVGRF